MPRLGWTAALALCAAAAPVHAQACPGGRAARGDVGIAALWCSGPAASCAINLDSAGGPPYHRFAVEPVVTKLTESAADLRVGDTLVAVDSMLITTVGGGAHLARLEPGRTVRVLVRRRGRLEEVVVETRRGCGIRSLRVTR